MTVMLDYRTARSSILRRTSVRADNYLLRARRWLGELPWVLCGSLVASTVLTPVSAAAQDPMTMMAFASLTQTALGLGAKPSTASLEAIMGIMQEMEALHGELESVQLSLKLALELISNLPDNVRQALDEDRDVQRSETVLGHISAIRRSISALNKLGNVTGAAQKADMIRQSIQLQLLVYYPERFAILRRSDFALPAIVAAMIMEVAVQRAAPDPVDRISSDLKEFEVRLAKTLDKSRPGSLAMMRADLEQAQANAERELAKRIMGREGQLAGGTYPWYAHTLVENREFARDVHCHTLTPGHVSTVPKFQYVELAKYNLVDSPCWETYKQQVQLHTRDFSRSLAVHPLPGYEVAGLYSIDLSVTISEAPGGKVGIPTHYEPDGVIEHPRALEAQNLQVEIAAFNRRAQAIAKIRDLETLASAALVLVANWEDNEAAKLESAVTALLATDGAAETQAALRATERKVQVAGANAQADVSSQTAVDTVRAARERLDRTIKEAQRAQWRSDVVAGLEVLKMSVTIYELARAPRRAPPAQVSAFKAARLAPQPAGKAGEGDAASGADPESSTTRANGGRSINEQASAVSGQNMSPTEAVTLNPIDRINLVEATIEQVREHDASKWTKLPIDFTAEEMALLAAMSQLDRFEPTEGDEFFAKYGGNASGTKMVTGAATQLRNGDILGAARTTAGILIGPVVIADETRLGEAHRTDLRHKLNDLFDGFAQMRLRQSLPSQHANELIPRH